MSTQKAWAIFTDETDLKYLKGLKRGFRHCFVILNDGKHWIACDPLASHIELTVPEIAGDFDLPRFLQTQGCITVPAIIAPQNKQAPLSLLSCVEAVKRILGIRHWWIFTPWQLYKYLIKQQETVSGAQRRRAESSAEETINRLKQKETTLWEA